MKFEEVGGNRVRVKKEAIPLSNKDQSVVEDATAYLNVNRLSNVILYRR